MKKLMTLFFFIISLVSFAEQNNLNQDRIQIYKAKNNDSLMLIAFKIYGDYRKWRELASLNPHLKERHFDLVDGEKIKFSAPDKLFKWEPLGNSYLIKSGDTLQEVSRKVYGTTRRWREIYENNKPLIRRENEIFVGFTLYYIPDSDIIP